MSVIDPDTFSFLSHFQTKTDRDSPLSAATEVYSAVLRRIHSNVYTSKFYYTFNSVSGKTSLHNLLRSGNGYAEYIIRTYYRMFTTNDFPDIEDVAKIMSSFY